MNPFVAVKWDSWPHAALFKLEIIPFNQSIRDQLFMVDEIVLWDERKLQKYNGENSYFLSSRKK